MSTDKATPRPWVCSKGQYCIRELNGRGSIIARTNIEHHDCNDVNAELIVRAVNSHDALLEACKAAFRGDADYHQKCFDAISQAEGGKV